MKEETAKTKWCPKAITSALEECTMGVTAYCYNRIDNVDMIPNECKCIASDCMMWVWDDGKIDTLGKLQRDGMGKRIIENSGHCGLIR